MKNRIGFAGLVVLFISTTSPSYGQDTDTLSAPADTAAHKQVILAIGEKASRADRTGWSPQAAYSTDDRVYLGLGYNWGKKASNSKIPKQQHSIYAHYSINQRAFSFGYNGALNQLVNKWDLLFNANVDLVRWTNFFGLGNETMEVQDDNNYYRLRSRQIAAGISAQHAVGKQGRFSFGPFYQRIEIIHDLDRFFALQDPLSKRESAFRPTNFAGLTASLTVQNLDNLLLPTKGQSLTVMATGVKNLNAVRSFANYNVFAQAYRPLSKRLILSLAAGGAATTGSPEFYQLNSVGGNRLRGYRSQRFWGESSFFNNNEIQYHGQKPVRMIKGKMGLVGFFDQGRVWKSGEESDVWHYGYGGGFFMVPFQKAFVSAQVGFSPGNARTFHLVFRRGF